jgi:uncharacterized protein YkwD
MPALGAARHDTRGRFLLTLAVLAALLAVPARPAAATAATTTTSVAEAILALANRDRDARGLRPLRFDGRLATIAEDRAGNLASATSFSHTAAGGSLSTPLAEASVQWYGWGEIIARWPGGLRTTTAASIYGAWKKSPPHWAALMSRDFNYVGFGTVLRAADGQVFASGVFTESRDHTAPQARIVSASRSGTTITFAWHGRDPALQTHWAKLRDFDVWLRRDGGEWRLIRDNTTATSVRLANRARGHRFEVMVRARDRAGNLGRPTAPVGIWVP